MQFYLEKMILFRKPTPRTADSGCLVVVSRETKMVILDGRSAFFYIFATWELHAAKKKVFILRRQNGQKEKFTKKDFKA